MFKKEIVIVCGYGCHLVPIYETYLKRAVRYILENPVELIVVCGGQSQKRTAPTRTEADAIYDFLKRHGLYNEVILKERESLTTQENLLGAKVLLQTQDPKQFRLVIFCDASRALKVKLLAMKIFPNYEISVETHDLSNGEEVRRQFKATILEVLSLKLPWLAHWHHHQRARRAERI